MAAQQDHFAQYQGREGGLLLTFQYPAAWRLQEEQGKIDLYRQVRVMGPRNSEDTYTCYLSVSGAPLKKHGGRFESAKERLAIYKGHLFSDGKVDRERERTFAGEKASDITVSYTIPPLHERGLKPIPIPVKTRTLFFEKGAYLYELIYSADSREYDLHVKAFEQLLKTFRFQ